MSCLMLFNSHHFLYFVHFENCEKLVPHLNTDLHFQNTNTISSIIYVWAEEKKLQSKLCYLCYDDNI